MSHTVEELEKRLQKAKSTLELVQNIAAKYGIKLIDHKVHLYGQDIEVQIEQPEWQERKRGVDMFFEIQWTFNVQDFYTDTLKDGREFLWFNISIKEEKQCLVKPQSLKHFVLESSSSDSQQSQ